MTGSMPLDEGSERFGDVKNQLVLPANGLNRVTSGVRLSLTRDEAITLLVRLDDLAQLEPEVPEVIRMRDKLRGLIHAR